ncbi:MAG: hypothetical protein H6970_15945 [Gammaproteobacteria bacterium]|nr:hypothetical protein [Gammaproteobacteria bacterium]MCP5458310.1 hypothetical protein [Gammaproteobacteria bacterium]
MAPIPSPNPSSPPDTPRRGWRYPLHIHIAWLCTLLILLLGLLLGWHSYRQLSQVIVSATDDVFERIGRESLLNIQRLQNPIEILTELLAFQQLQDASTLDERLDNLPYLREALNYTPTLSALYIGYADGDFFLIRPLRENGATGDAFGAPPRTAYVVQSVERQIDGGAQARFLFFDARLQRLGEVARPDFAHFDPRVRSWYRAAIQADDHLARTDPYVFYTTRQPGLTFSRRTGNGKGVAGADLTLADLSTVLARQWITPSAELAIFSTNGEVIAYRDPTRMILPDDHSDRLRLARLGDLHSTLAEAGRQYQPGKDTQRLMFELVGREWRGRLIPLDHDGLGKIALVVLAPVDELLAEANALRQRNILVTALIVLLSLPLAWLLSRAIAKPLRDLADEARAIESFDFSQHRPVRSLISEIDQLAGAMALMKVSLSRFIEIGSSLTAEKDFERLMQRIVRETAGAACVDTTVLYLAADDDSRLDPVLMLTGDELRASTDVGLGPVDLSAPGLLAEAVKTGAACATELSGGAHPFSILRPTPAAAVLVPLKNRDGEAIGLLCLLREHTLEQAPVAPKIVAFLEALGGAAAIAVANQRLLKAQKDLLQALIKLVANAIDAKSAYTGGHCQRVPELTLMLARAAHDATDGPFADFRLNDDEWETLRIAAWLHDCGKMTTPEYVVDKATKLETLWDRIHEIRMRFEALKRDAEIAYWKALHDGASEPEERLKRDERLSQLDEDYAFIAECNVGGEFMAPERQERVKRIAQRTWMRTLDDRIGIAHEEKTRKDRTPAPSLPTLEPLLADKAEHVFPRDERDSPPTDNPWGFKLAAPRYLYNKGEIYNLCIDRGTLTEEERYKINDHIVQTIVMLSQLPFPKHLRQVPEIAGGHHERMDGAGYPKRLTRDQMSLPARMMAIADIFEALTAVDRPYKKGKTLSEAIRIMNSMKRNGHVDPDLFDLFLSSEVYRRYGERFLRPDQIDTA